MTEQPDNQIQDIELTKSKEIIESYIFSTSRRRLSIYSERLLMRLVEIAQIQVNGINFRDGQNIGRVSIGTLGDVTIDIPIKSLFSGEVGSAGSYSQAKAAVGELMNAAYSVERPKLQNGKPVLDEEGKPTYEFIAHQILNDCEVNVKPGIAQVVVNKNTWISILDFSKGFRRWDLNAALKLNRSCSARMFRLISNVTDPITYSLDELRRMWGLENKYLDNNDFVKRTIQSAKDELDEKAPWTFEFQKNYREGGRTITSVTFFPKHQVSKLSTSSTLKSDSPLSVLGRELYELLLNKFEFTVSGINSNINLFKRANAEMDLIAFLNDLAPNALNASNVPGYVIRAIERKLKEGYGQVENPQTQDKTQVKSEKKSRKSRLGVNTAEAFNNSGLEEL